MPAVEKKKCHPVYWMAFLFFSGMMNWRKEGGLRQKKQPRPLAWRGESPRVIQPSDARVHAQQRTGCAPGQPRSKRADVARCVQGTCVWFIAGDGLPAPRHAAHARQQRQ